MKLLSRRAGASPRHALVTTAAVLVLSFTLAPASGATTRRDPFAGSGLSSANDLLKFGGSTRSGERAEEAHPASRLRATPAWVPGRGSAKTEKQNAVLSTAAAAGGPPSAPFNECPAVGYDTSCGLLIVVDDNGATVYGDPTQGPFDGVEDTLIGVRNSSSHTLGHLNLSSNTDLFGFDNDGLCSVSPAPSGCPFGATGYEGPGTSFSNISSTYNGGTVDFAGGIPPGGTAYFSLEESLDSATLVTGGPGPAEQGGAGNPSEHSTTCSKGRPVNCATGTFWHRFTDVRVPGHGVPLTFERTYQSSAAVVDSPLGHGWTHTFDMALATAPSGAVTVRQEDGSEVTFQPNGSGGFTAPPRVLATLVQNGDGTYTFTRKMTSDSYVFSSAGQLVSEADRNGYQTILSYSGGRLSTVTDTAGRTLTFAYSGSHISSVTDPAGHVTSFQYDANGDLTKATDPLGHEWAFTYDANHLMLTMTDPRGGTTTNTYDASNRVTRQVDPAGRATAWSYTGDNGAPSGGTTTMTDPRGVDTLYDYANLELNSVTHAAGTSQAATTAYTYDPATLGRTSITDPNGHVTTNTFDPNGNLTSTTDPLGRSKSFAYDSFGNVIWASDAIGNVTTFSYDAHGNLLTRDATLAETGDTVQTKYAYEGAAGDVSAVTDPNGHTETFEYDAAGNRTSATDPTGRPTTAAYDVLGRRISETSPGGHTKHYAYDAIGELLSVTDALGHVTSYEFDGNGNQTAATTPTGKKTTRTYNSDDELVEVKTPDGSAQAIGRDPGGNKISNTDAAGHETSYTYDLLNRRTATTTPDGATTHYGYDAAGNRTSVTDPQDRTTTFGYDEADELASVDYSDGTTPSVSYGYDEDGRRTSMEDGTDTTSWTYDSLGRVTSVTNGAGSQVSYSYDLAGRLTSIQYPNGQAVARTYDDAGRLLSTTDWLGHTSSFGYDPEGNWNQSTYGNGVTGQTTFDAVDQPTSMKYQSGGTDLASFAYGRNADEQVTTANATGVPGGNSSYGYDAKSRVTSVNGHPYSYDAADDLTGLPDGTKQQFNDASELVHTTPGASKPSPTKVAPPSMVAVRRTAPARTSSDRRTLSVGALRAGDLAVAFVSAGGPARKRQSVLSVKGGGLTWTRAALANKARGTAEVWEAYTGRPVRPSVVTARLKYARRNSALTVATFRGAAKQRRGGQAAVTGVGRSVTLRTKQAGSVVVAAGFDAKRAAKRVPKTGQSLVSQTLFGKSHSTAWAERTGSIARAGTRVAIGTRAPAGAADLGAVEIAPATHVSSPSDAAVPVYAPSVATDYSYNANGSRTAVKPVGAAKVDLRYDQANRLTSYGPSATYTYNGDGLRMGKTVAGKTTDFTYDETSSTPALLVAGSTAYVYGPNATPIEQIDGDTPTYLHQDQQGSTRLLTGQDGKLAATYTYDAWGKVVGHTGKGRTDLLYNGEYTDLESGYQYLRTRYYDPATGQFLTADPAFDLDLLRYAYAGDDPVNAIDPTGQFEFTLLGTFIGGVVGGTFGALDYAINHEGDWNWREFGGSVAGGTVGGAVSGACLGTTAQLMACGALGGAAGAAVDDWISGKPITPTDLLVGGLIGGATGGLPEKFPMRGGEGMRPRRLYNIWNPGPNTVRWWGNEGVEELVGTGSKTIVDWWRADC